MPLTSRIFPTLFLILACSCERPIPEIIYSRQQLNLDYQVVEHYDNKPLDRLNNGQNFYTDIVIEGLDYGMSKCICTLSNGLIEIRMSAAYGFVGHELKITVNDPIFNSVYEHFGDIEVEHYKATPIRQNLILNTHQFEMGRTIHGSIDFEGIVFTDLLRDMTAHKVKLLGNFGCILNEKVEHSF